ncbi:MAG TPA: transporter substrate-binding domain-containing protein [Acetobacteraceae bacterium]|nr:transporter substrate-binding domain-containing protein [Acetobacteraceae bacterium]
MTNRISRRGIAAGTALLPAAALIGTARAQPANESTFDRVQRTKTLRVAALPGELPYFQKDITTGGWSGACIDMATSIAKVFNAKLEYLEATYGTSVLDLQTNKVDLAFALNPTPERALSIGFTHPMIVHPFGCLAKQGFNPKTWDDINKADIRIAFDIGSLHETCAKRFAPKAQHVGFTTRDQCILALQSGRVDVDILAALLGLAAVGKNPALGPYHLLTDPQVALPSCLGIQQEPDTRFATVLNAWLDFNRGIGQLREWLIGGLEKMGVTREQIPSELTF